MNKHTPGPWFIPPENGCYIVDEDKGRQICSLDNRQNRLADAHLIAAAPDLLVALREMMREYECTDDSDLNGAIILARAAIIKVAPSPLTEDSE